MMRLLRNLFKRRRLCELSRRERFFISLLRTVALGRAGGRNESTDFGSRLRGLVDKLNLPIRYAGPRESLRSPQVQLLQRRLPVLPSDRNGPGER
jgi:hypothetical protein